MAYEEYKIYTGLIRSDYLDTDVSRAEAALNNLGKAGWQLVSVHGVTGDTLFVFKRLVDKPLDIFDW